MIREQHQRNTQIKKQLESFLNKLDCFRGDLHFGSSLSSPYFLFF